MINLFVNTFVHPNRERMMELIECERRNREIRKSVGINNLVVILGRPTYDEMFRRTDSSFSCVNIISNADVYFDESLELVNKITSNEAWCLGRYEDGILVDRPDMQDVWIFRGPPRNVKADFQMGVMGCDNRLAYELEMAGYFVRNPAKSIRAHHLHKHAVKTREERASEPVVPGPYLHVPPEEL